MKGRPIIVFVRNKQTVVRLVPGAPRMTALQALADLYRTLDDAAGAAWLADAAKDDRLLAAEARDLWA